MDLNTEDVFTAGGLPSITYFSRDNFRLENKLKRSLKMNGKMISITGPTKSGKSVLCNKVIPPENSVWIMGGQINEEDDLWNIITSKLQIAIGRSDEEASENGKKSSIQAKGTFNALLGKASIGSSNDRSSKTGTKTTDVYTFDKKQITIDFLIEKSIPLLIDDFHYIDRSLQLSIVRALKGGVLEGLKVILLAVPHRSYDAIEVENEMTGRLFQIKISPWEEQELLEIAKKGFEALNLNFPEEIVDCFAREAFGSPHLMQEFCLLLCYENDIYYRQDIKNSITTIPNYGEFFEEIVSTSTSNVIFEKLAMGPNRGDRKERNFKSGRQGDIYESILAALGGLQETSRVTPEDIRQKLVEILEPKSVPLKHQITNVLKQMDRIAKNDIEGEPAIDFKDDILHIVDPFFMFYIRWVQLV